MFDCGKGNDMTALLESRSAPTLSAGARVRLAPAAPQLWRVSDESGRVIGHLQVVGDGEGVRFRARRFHRTSRAFVDVGEFWSADDAAECLRLTR
jgi:hypothetical protein